MLRRSYAYLLLKYRGIGYRTLGICNRDPKGPSRPLRERVAKTAGYSCGYGRTPQSIASFRLSIEHIIPEAKGGPNG
jgi:hypothetical protein